jgi:signal transduction histidine kinase
MLAVADAFIVVAEEGHGPTRVDVAALVRELGHLVEPFARERRIEFSVADAPPASMRVDASELRLGILDHLVALVEETPAGTRLVLHVDAGGSSQPHSVTLRLVNETPGTDTHIAWTLEIQTPADRPTTATHDQGA